jgi:hypothetical protein
MNDEPLYSWSKEELFEKLLDCADGYFYDVVEEICEELNRRLETKGDEYQFSK